MLGMLAHHLQADALLPLPHLREDCVITIRPCSDQQPDQQPDPRLLEQEQEQEQEEHTPREQQHEHFFQDHNDTASDLSQDEEEEGQGVQPEASASFYDQYQLGDVVSAG